MEQHEGLTYERDAERRQAFGIRSSNLTYELTDALSNAMVKRVHNRYPEFDTKGRKLLIYIGRASNLPLQKGHLRVLRRFSDVQSLQHFGLRIVNG